MATYYWIGAQNTDINNRYNWTLYNPGFTGATAALSRPPYGSAIVFTKFTGITGGGTAGATYYPLYGPSGFFYGATLSGATAQYLTSCQIRKNFDKDIGGSSVYLSLFANEIIIEKGSTGNITNNYLNIYENPLGAGPTYDYANVVIKSEMGATGVRQFNTIEGYANQILIGDNGITTMADITLKNLEIADYIENTSVNAYDKVYLGDDLVVSAGSTHLLRGPIALTVARGLNFSDSVTLDFRGGPNGLGSVTFAPFGVSGASGATGAKGSSLIHTFKAGGDRALTNYSYYHGVLFSNFYAEGGKHTFYQGNDDPVIIRGGFLIGTQVKLISEIDSNVTILDDATYSGGFQIQNSGSNQSWNPLSLAGNYGLKLSNVPQGYTYG
jgi:hypothetical protein